MRSYLSMIVLGLGVACGGGGKSGSSGGHTSGGASGSGSASGSGGGGNPVTNPTCPSGCPSGEFCFDGLCAVGCMADSNCAADQYCDTQWTHLCQDRAVPSCTSSGDCQTGQQCVDGLCTATLTQQPAQQCNPKASLASGEPDGCDASSVCLPAATSSGTPYCQSFPACGAPGSNPECPVGQYGALCNDGYLPGKGRFCMPQICKSAENCPASWGCVTFPSGPGLGECSNGSFGAACDASHPCQSGLSCQSAGTGSFGYCLSGGFTGGSSGGGSSSGGCSGQSVTVCQTSCDCAPGLSCTAGHTCCGGAGSAPGGSACNSDCQCQSLSCLNGNCATGGGSGGGSTTGGASGGGSSGGSGSGCPGPGSLSIGGSCTSNCDCQSEYCQSTNVGQGSVCCSGPGTWGVDASCSTSCDCSAGLGCTAGGTCCAGPGAGASGAICGFDCDCASLNCQTGTCA